MHALLSLLAFFPLTCPAQEEVPTAYTYPEILAWMTDLDWLWSPPAPDERCLQFASFDPGSRSGIGNQEAMPGDPKGWYANIDRGHYLRTEERAGETEWVLADVDGPGVIVRIWSANPTGTLFFYVDGATEPTWSAGFAELTGGEVEPFTEPLAGVRGRGYNFHAPLPFLRHMKVTCSKDDHHYQVNVRLLPPGSTVPSLDPALLRDNEDAIGRAREALRGAPPRGPTTRLAKEGVLAMAGNPLDPSDWVAEELVIAGPGIIRELGVSIPRGQTDALEHRDLLRAILLEIEFDGVRTVKVPVGDFFGAAPDFRGYGSYPMGVAAEGRGYCRFPMPVPGEARVRLLADGPLPPVHFALDVAFEERTSLPPDALAFHAAWHLRKQVRTRPFSSFRVLNADGPGRFVGGALVFANPSKYWWGEGDEKIFVDGEDFPSTFGTGTEDYFGYAWADPTPFAGAFHAQPQCDGPDNYGYTSLDRFQIHDQIPFQHALLFDLEIWHWKDVYVDYATTAWWYGRPAARSGLPWVPAPDYRVVDDIVPEPIFHADGALEAEELRVLSTTTGPVAAGLMGWFDEGNWSNEQHILWTEAGPGDELTLAVPVAREGTYAVEAVFTCAADYGIVQVLLNGHELGEPIDLFVPHGVVPTKRLRLGELWLPAGEVPLVLRLTGKNARAHPGYLVGLDYLRLTPVQGD